MPPGIPQSFDEHIKLMFDLLALAYQADLTRVGTLLFARDLTGRRYPESAAPNSGFHGVSHHGEDPGLIETLSKINQYHVKALAHFVDKLAKTEDGDGTLLDHSLLLVRQQHGQSQPTPALRRAARADRRQSRRDEGRAAPGVPHEDRIHG